MPKNLARALILTGGLLYAPLLLAQLDAPKPEQGSGEGPALIQPGTPAKEGPSEQDKRILGVLPNYRTADGTKPFVPMTAKGKMTIAAKDSFDYPGFITAGVLTLIYQADNSNPSFGQGVKGFAHRYATSVSDQIIGNMLTEGFMPVLLKEDPRYFRKINGSFWSRFTYSATRTLIAKNDRGKACINFAELGGNGISASIGNLYYPDERSASDTFTRMGTAIATDTISNILKEFWPDIKRKWSKNKTVAGSIQ